MPAAVAKPAARRSTGIAPLPKAKSDASDSDFEEF